MAQWIAGINLGDWYQVGRKPPFEVVGVDLHAETVELQHYDGTVAELDFETWHALSAVPVPAPEDPSGAMDMDQLDASSAGAAAWRWRWSSPADQLDLMRL